LGWQKATSAGGLGGCASRGEEATRGREELDLE